ncbi:MAG: GIY-YIG nuclease family protein [Pyrinomonadaceae bacterium]
METIDLIISDGTEVFTQKQRARELGHIGGYVYVIEERPGKVKIGKTVDPYRRIGAIKTQSGLKGFTKVFASPEHLEYNQNESILHHLFKYRRTVGEWFNESFDTIVTTLGELTMTPPQPPILKDAQLSIEEIRDIEREMTLPASMPFKRLVRLAGRIRAEDAVLAQRVRDGKITIEWAIRKLNRRRSEA